MKFVIENFFSKTQRKIAHFFWSKGLKIKFYLNFTQAVKIFLKDWQLDIRAGKLPIFAGQP